MNQHASTRDDHVGRRADVVDLGLGRLLAGALLSLCLFLSTLTVAPLAAAGDAGGTVVLRPTVGTALKRFALVIGNGAYRNVQSLRNPTNDAAAVAAKLQQIGYSVVYARDVDRRGMNQAADTFLAMVEPGSEALVYYSGHGVDLNGSELSAAGRHSGLRS